MSVLVVCPGCHTRFQVSDKFAGKKGSCPKCKGVIEVPAADAAVKVHAPENYGPKDAKGRETLRPIERETTKASPIMIGSIIGGTLVAFLVALMFRIMFGVNETPWFVSGLGLLAITPLIVYGGYWILRDRELEGHRGRSLYARLAICSAVYMGLWAAYMPLPEVLSGMHEDYWIWLVLAVPFLVVGSFAAFGTLDLQGASAFFHYSLYLLVTVLLRLTMGMDMIRSAAGVEELDPIAL